MKTPDKSMLARDKRAQEALQKYEEEGLPFVLYLRDFAWEKWVGPRGQDTAQHEPIFNAVTRTLPADCGFVLVQNQGAMFEGLLSPFKGPHDPAPGLLLEDDTWQEVVAWLIPRASLIICQLMKIGKGTEWELLKIIQAGQRHKTLLLLPGLGEGLPLLDAHPVVRMFTRCVYYDEIAESGPLAHVAAEDLTQRLGTLVENRSAKDDSPNDDPEACAPPIFYDPQLARAYGEVGYGLDVEANPRSRFKTDDFGRAAKTREIAFWSYARNVALSEYIWARHPEQMTREFTVELLDSYARIGEMCLTDYSTAGDPAERLGLGDACIQNAMHLQSRSTVRLANERLEKLEKKYRAIRFLAKLPRTPAGGLASFGPGAKPQAQDSQSVPAGAKTSIAAKLKALFRASTGRSR